MLLFYLLMNYLTILNVKVSTYVIVCGRRVQEILWGLKEIMNILLRSGMEWGCLEQ